MTYPATGVIASLRRLGLCALLALAAAPCAAQNCGWSRVDHLVTYDASGMWNPKAYRGALVGLTVAGMGGALWEGSQTRLGRTMWQGFDAELVAGATAEVGKLVFTRARPNEGGNPCLWFQGSADQSFPSLESAAAAGLVTPYIIEYGAESPATYALLLLPLYVGAGRIKNQAHWQTDVVTGWAIGGLSGWFSHSLQTPIMIRLLPDGFEVGFKAQF